MIKTIYLSIYYLRRQIEEKKPMKKRDKAKWAAHTILSFHTIVSLDSGLSNHNSESPKLLVVIKPISLAILYFFRRQEERQSPWSRWTRPREPRCPAARFWWPDREGLDPFRCQSMPQRVCPYAGGEAARAWNQHGRAPKSNQSIPHFWVRAQYWLICNPGLGLLTIMA